MNTKRSYDYTEICRLYRLGNRIRTIADLIGCTAGTVTRVLDIEGLRPRFTPRVQPDLRPPRSAGWFREVPMGVRREHR